ncbi:MAG: hypothetical protein JSR77_00920 [Planctomycetes bacterium]|nr:hypothetical protein [Planctomycetota bacterium]
MNRFLAACLLCAAAAPAMAQCSANFSYTDFSPLGGPISDLRLNGSAALQDGVLRLTPNAVGQSGAAWYQLSRAAVGNGFDVRFRFRIADGSADGFAFVIQNESTAALGGTGSDLGYGGITRSLAVEFDTFGFSDEFGTPHISIQTRGNGANETSDSSSLGHVLIGTDIADGVPHDVQVSYQPGLLTVVMDNGTAALSVPLDLHTLNGDDILFDDGPGECAWIGFTAATGGATANQEILSWSCEDESQPECSGAANFPDFSDSSHFNFVGAAHPTENVLRLTDAESGQAGAAWYIDSMASLGDGFATDFTFRITEGCADGLAFVIQKESVGAIGDGGSGLGYASNGGAGISRCLAVEFDTFGFSDEFGTPHVSVQSAGNAPNEYSDSYSLGHLVLSSIDLCDGEPHTARIEYIPGLMRITVDGLLSFDTPVDLHDILGDDILFQEVFSQCGYVGFTAGTGGAVAKQDILSWSMDDTFTGGGCVPPAFIEFPDSSVRISGQRAEFTMNASGSGPFTYSWSLNSFPLEDGGRISGAHTNTLVIDPILPSESGQLDFTIGNVCGSTSSGFELFVSCYGDFNQDGGIDGSDVDAFFAAWEAGDASADVNLDGGVDGGDVATFFAAWEAGGCF